jgi:DinB superfamily
MDLQFPIGKFHRPTTPIDAATRAAYIDDIERMPAALRATVAGLSETQLDTPYRPGGWTVRQVVHHVPDSHMNAYVRFKLAVTEDTPTIKPYKEDRWAELPDARAPIGPSLDLLDAVHRRWVLLLRGLPAEEFRKAYNHPDMGIVALDAALALYAWHGKHHTAHVQLVAHPRA